MNVKNEDLVKGKEYLTGDEKCDLDHRVFLAINSRGDPMFEQAGVGRASFSFKIIQEIEEEHWSLDTCPLPPFTVKHKTDNTYKIVTEIRENVLFFVAGSCSYEYLYKNHRYIPDRNNRNIELPCGPKKLQPITKPPIKMGNRVKATLFDGTVIREVANKLCWSEDGIGTIAEWKYI